MGHSRVPLSRKRERGGGEKREEGRWTDRQTQKKDTLGKKGLEGI